MSHYLRRFATPVLLIAAAAVGAMLLLLSATQPAAAQSVTSISPSSGLLTESTAVTVRGSGFDTDTELALWHPDFTEDVPLNITQVHDSTRISAVVPPGPDGGEGAWFVRIDGTIQNVSFTYLTVAPGFTSITPNFGPTTGGTEVEIRGSGFVSGATVRFRGIPATDVTVVNSTTITAVTPSNVAGLANVGIRNPFSAERVAVDAFRYIAGDPPRITDVTPNSGRLGGGNNVTIIGTGFIDGAEVRFGNREASQVDVVSATSITARVPSAMTTGVVDVRVTNIDGQTFTLTNAYTYGPPQLSSISPSSGPAEGGTLVTLNGSNFSPRSTVIIGGEEATDVQFVNRTQLRARTAPRAAGVVSVVVRSEGGLEDQLQTAFTYEAPTGQIISGSIAPSGVSQFIFGGGTNADLTALAIQAGCPSQDVAFFVTVGGQWVSFRPDVPAFVNAAWNNHFGPTLPTGIPMLSLCLR